MTGSPALPRRFRDCAALVCLSLAAVGPAACFRLGSSEDKPLSQYNLILINIDSLRADHLGTYGYGRDTSPFIDELAAEGIVFERAFSNSSYTRESVASLLSGRLPSVAGSTGWYATLSEEARSLSESFRASGCETGFFSNTIMLRDPGFTQGFDEVQHLPERWGISGAGLRLSKRALAFVADRGGRRFMMYLHYLDPHGPYDPAAEHYLRFSPQVSASPLRLYTDLRPRLPELLRDGVRPGEARFEDLIRRYDAEIFDTDRAVEALFRGLEELDLLDGTLVVITADHGEEFLEHGFVEHAWTLYRESLHVPLILWAPLAFGPSRIDAPVSGIDIAPTLLHLMEVPYDGSDLDDNFSLDLDEGAHEAVITDGASVEIGRFDDSDSLAKGDVFDA